MTKRALVYRRVFVATLMGCVSLTGATVLGAPVSFNYAGADLVLSPRAIDTNLLGSRVLGRATFDDTIVTPGFTGTLGIGSRAIA